MSYLNQMYGRKSSPTPSKSDKNPNRVAGGLRAQGADTMMVLGEDGNQTELPTLAYVRSLEEQTKKQRAAITVLERKLARQGKSLESLETFVRAR